MVVNDSLACCGLDPDLTKAPVEIAKQRRSDEAKVLNFLREVIDLTGSHVCAYKIQKAFFDVLPRGHTLLVDVIEYAQEHYPQVPVFVDAKIGDIDNTMTAYLRNIFKELGADGVVLNPYMGDDVITPMQEFADKAGIVLAKTSNPGGSVIQDVLLSDGQPFWRHVLDLTVNRWNQAGNLIPVLSSTADIDFSGIRKAMTDTMPVLFAGFGAQGGSLKHFRQLLDSSSRGVFVNSSRGLLYPYESDDKDWRQKVAAATVSLKETLNTERKRNGE
jgi:orotidine-5'-phosphate decarboxylase